MARRTFPYSKAFDPTKVRDAARMGGVDWSSFNEHFERLLTADWRGVNAGSSYPLGRRLLRLWLAYLQCRSNAILDLEGKADLFFRLDIPPDPHIVFFGAEVGWEAIVLQSLFGAGGRILLIDNDPEAYRRFRNAPCELRIRAPRGWKVPEILLARDPSRIEYARADFFTLDCRNEFDVGIDWGLIEHYEGPQKQAVLKCFQSFLRMEGLQISSCPRDCLAVRLFYWAFSDELNFGYRELMTLAELRQVLEEADFRVEKTFRLRAHNVAVSRRPA